MADPPLGAILVTLDSPPPDGYCVTCEPPAPFRFDEDLELELPTEHVGTVRTNNLAVFLGPIAYNYSRLLYLLRQGYHAGLPALRSTQDTYVSEAVPALKYALAEEVVAARNALKSGARDPLGDLFLKLTRGAADTPSVELLLKSGKSLDEIVLGVTRTNAWYDAAFYQVKGIAGTFVITVGVTALEMSAEDDPARRSEIAVESTFTNGGSFLAEVLSSIAGAGATLSAGIGAAVGVLLYSPSLNEGEDSHVRQTHEEARLRASASTAPSAPSTAHPSRPKGRRSGARGRPLRVEFYWPRKH